MQKRTQRLMLACCLLWLGLLGAMGLGIGGKAEAQASPSSRSSNVLWFDADAITGQVDGTAFTGSTAGFSAPTAANRPTYRATAFAGHAALTFNRTASPSQFITLPLGTNTALDNARTGAYTVQFIFRLADISNIQSVFSQGGNGNKPLFFVSATNNSNFNFERFSDLSTGILSAGVVYLIQYTFVPTTAGNGTETFFVNGNQVATRTGSIAAIDPSTPWTIGSFQFPFGGDVFDILVDNTALSSATLASDTAFFRSRMIAGQSTAQIVCVGDSRTLGVGVSNANNYNLFSYPAQMASVLPMTQYGVADRGINGYTVEQLQSDAPNRYLDYNPLYRTNIAIIWAGVNDWLSSSNTSSGAASNFASLVKGYEANGFKTAYCTEADFGSLGSATSAGAETWRAAYNTALLPLLPLAPSRARIDLAADGRIGAVNACANTTYNSGDYVHWRGEDASGTLPGGGYGVVASYAAPVAATLAAVTPTGTKRRLQ